MCEDWVLIARWLTFLGAIMGSVAAVMLAINGTSVFGRLMEWHASRVFRDLVKQEEKTRKAIDAARVSPLLTGSKTVTELKEARLKGARFGLDLQAKLHVIPHDRLRRMLRLEPMKIIRDDGLIAVNALAFSKEQIDEEIRDLIEEPLTLFPRAVRLSFGLLLLGFLLVIAGALPIC